MTDNELRGIILAWFYEHRREGNIVPKPENFNPPIHPDDLYRICDQLAENNLLDWNPHYSSRSGTLKTDFGVGKISAKGVDVIEGNAIPSIAINLNVQLSFSFIISNIISQIEQANASEEEKRNVKSRLKAFLEHPLVTSVLGGLAGELVRILGV